MLELDWFSPVVVLLIVHHTFGSREVFHVKHLRAERMDIIALGSRRALKGA
jgi:hypothetical protein